jgi:hypothetical protein
MHLVVDRPVILTHLGAPIGSKRSIRYDLRLCLGEIVGRNSHFTAVREGCSKKTALRLKRHVMSRDDDPTPLMDHLRLDSAAQVQWFSDS